MANGSIPTEPVVSGSRRILNMAVKQATLDTTATSNTEHIATAAVRRKVQFDSLRTAGEIGRGGAGQMSSFQPARATSPCQPRSRRRISPYSPPQARSSNPKTEADEIIELAGASPTPEESSSAHYPTYSNAPPPPPQLPYPRNLDFSKGQPSVFVDPKTGVALQLVPIGQASDVVNSNTLGPRKVSYATSNFTCRRSRSAVRDTLNALSVKNAATFTRLKW